MELAPSLSTRDGTVQVGSPRYVNALVQFLPGPQDISLHRAELYASLKWYDAQVASIVVNIYDTKLTQLKAEFDKQSGSLTEVSSPSGRNATHTPYCLSAGCLCGTHSRVVEGHGHNIFQKAAQSAFFCI